MEYEPRGGVKDRAAGGNGLKGLKGFDRCDAVIDPDGAGYCPSAVKE
jgi:hypothetical protein